MAASLEVVNERRDYLVSAFSPGKSGSGQECVDHVDSYEQMEETKAKVPESEMSAEISAG